MITDEFTIKVSGILDGKLADSLAEGLERGNVYVFDFSGVEDVRFSGLRSLLRSRRDGFRFMIINACPEVAERFEDTGVSSYVSICRKPRPLKIGEYEEFGASFLSKSFYGADGDSMIKVYGPRVPKWMVAQEKVVARAVMRFGIPTPLVGTVYEDGGNTALEFERIEGKKSFSRIIADEPERLEEISRRFARMCKELHSTQCDTAVFPDRTIYYRRAVKICGEITEDERAAALAFIDNIPACTTCLHGDMQLSNVITNGEEDLWIDLADFGYGYPMLDMGMWYFQSMLNTEERARNLYHLGVDDMRRIWDYFVEEYFGAVTPEQKACVCEKVEKFSALHMLYLGASYGFEPGMLGFIRKKILRR